MVALGAKKAFESVSHKYIESILNVVGLCEFILIFKLLYNDLENDIAVNGQIGKGYKISNGVKQWPIL
jgi:hypothetical protein